MTGAANIDGEGNRFANRIKGNSGNNILWGNDGDDIIDGGDGVDQLYGGNGSDTFIVDSIDDVIDAGSKYEEDVIQSSVSFTLASKKIKGYLHRLTLTDEGGDINATGANQKDILIGNAGNNVLDGGTDTDKMIGGDGNDTYIVDKSDDVVDETGTGGHDTVRASSSYSLSTNAKGAVEDLVLTGTDAINGTGNDLDNVITGNAASNVLNGGAGADRLIGGFGDDTYVVDNSA
ncbi:calcium-binding protein, partial [Streptomyces sp. NPDC055722]